jgi:hypothetical protein
MERIIYLLVIILAGAIITFYSCTKENQKIKDNSEECVSCQEGLEVAKQIKQFKDRLQTATDKPYKDGDEMTREDAIENMEMLFNASHGFATETYSAVQVDTVEFDLVADAQGNIPATDVAMAYDVMYNSVKTVYDNIGFADKHLVALSLHNGEGNSIKAVATTGNKSEDPPPDPTPFDDCRWYGKNNGMCDGNLEGKLDGGDTIANILFLNRPLLIIGCPPTHHLITVPDYQETFDGNGSLEEGYIFYLLKDINLWG